MKVLIVDDHAVVRQGVQRLVATLPNTVVFEAATAHEALATVRRETPDIVVLDINLGGASGLELLRRLKLESPSSRVLIFSMHAEPIYASRALKTGAHGYVSKSASSNELVTAIQKVGAGETYVDASMNIDMLPGSADSEHPLGVLTNRELEVLRMLGEGKSLQAIADAIGIAYKTVANTCSRIKEKLNLPRTSDLIRFSIESRRN